jgi:hypothetical protein
MKTYRCILFRSAIPGYVEVATNMTGVVSGTIIPNTIICEGEASPESALSRTEKRLSLSSKAFQMSIHRGGSGKVALTYQPYTGIVFLDGAPCGVIQKEGKTL